MQSAWRRRPDADLLDAAANRLERLLAPAPAYSDGDTYYGYEPLPARDYLDGLAALGAPAGRSLCDLGCGIGTKLALAEEAGWGDLHGVDHDESYVEIARRLVPSATLLVADALTVALADYDVVYMFVLARTPEGCAACERSALERMRSGAVAFFPHAGVAGDYADQLAAHVWVVR